MLDLQVLFAAVIRLSSGQRLQVYRLVESLAQELGAAAQPLRDLLAEAIAHDQRTRALEDSRRASGRVYSPEVQELDSMVDSLLLTIRDILAAHIRDGDIDPEASEPAARVMQTMFPKGLTAVTKLPYVDQAAAVLNLIQTLQTEHTEAVEFLGLGRKVATLVELAQEYREAVDREPEDVEASEIREANQQGHIYLLEMASIIAGTWHNSRDPEQVAIRGRLLAPLFAAIDQTRAKRRARRAARLRSDTPTTGDTGDTDLDDTGDTDLDDVDLDDVANPAAAAAPGVIPPDAAPPAP